MPTMVVSRLAATVGSDTAKILLAVPAKKLPSAAFVRSNQLARDSDIEFSRNFFHGLCHHTGDRKAVSRRLPSDKTLTGDWFQKRV
jgi:hypothetical protein